MVMSLMETVSSFLDGTGVEPRNCGGGLLQGSDEVVAHTTTQGLFALGQIHSTKPLMVDKMPNIPKPHGTQNKVRTPVKMATEVNTMAICSSASA